MKTKTFRTGVVKYVSKSEYNWPGIDIGEPREEDECFIRSKRYFDCPPQHGLFVREADILQTFSKQETAKLEYQKVEAKLQAARKETTSLKMNAERHRRTIEHENARHASCKNQRDRFKDMGSSYDKIVNNWKRRSEESNNAPQSLKDVETALENARTPIQIANNKITTLEASLAVWKNLAHDWQGKWLENLGRNDVET